MTHIQKDIGLRARQSRLAVAVSALLALLLLAGVACSSGPSESAPTAADASAPAVLLTRPPTSVPTLAPTEAPTEPPTVAAAAATAIPTDTPAPPPTVAAATATPGIRPETTPTDGQRRSPESAAIFDDLPLLEERAFSYLSELAEDVGVRTSGTDLEHAAAQYLVGRLEELGYSPEVQEFSWGSPTGALELADPDTAAPDVNILTGTADGHATGPLALVGLARPEDIPAEGLEGKIALIERGEIRFGDKVARVHDAGAVAAIIYNNLEGNFRGSLGGRGRIPAISLSQMDGLELRESLIAGETVEVTVVVQDTAVQSQNVIAELPGTGDGVIVIGAHYDTVPDSVGASDNSSGAGALLAVAERLAGRAFPFSLRFVAFGSEETGLHGSRHYVESLSGEELAEIHLMINLDSIGSGDGLMVSGDRWAVRHVEETAAREGIPLEVSGTSLLGSDHANFRNAWVPTVFLWGNDLSRINSPADTMEHINRDLLGHATALTLDLLESVDALPGYGQ